jgi:hypothetical protein
MSIEPGPRLLLPLESRWTYLSLLALFITIGVLSEARSLAGPDIAFFLYAARNVVDGARLYQDVVEINPPLIIALNAPAVLLSRITGWSEILWYRALTTAVLLGSLLLSTVLVRRVAPLAEESFRRWIVLLICFDLFIVAAPDYGQREHLLLALVIPYLLVTTLRAQGRAVPTRLAIALGILGGIGFGLKPHFLLIWLALEAWLLLKRRGHAPWVRPESAALVLTLILYAAATLILAPEYLELVRLLAPEYGRFLGIPFGELLLSGRGAPLVLLAGLVYVGLSSRARYRDLWMVLLLATIAGFLAAAAQQKGWRYHFLPAMAALFMFLGVAAVDAVERIKPGIRALYAAMALGVTATGIIWLTGAAVKRAAGLSPEEERAKASLAELADELTSRGQGSSVFVFSFATSSGFPLVNYTGLEWTSRFPQLWLLVATYWDRLTADAPLRYRERSEMPPAERFLNDAVYRDLADHQPDLLLVLRHARDAKGNGPRRLDYLGYFGRDPRIAEVLRRYRFVRDIGEFGLYERLPGGAPLPDQVTRPKPGTLDLPPRRPRGWTGLVANRDLLLQILLFLLLTFIALRAVRGDPREER